MLTRDFAALWRRSARQVSLAMRGPPALAQANPAPPPKELKGLLTGPRRARKTSLDGPIPEKLRACPTTALSSIFAMAALRWSSWAEDLARPRRPIASDEPAGTTVIDFANTRLFVATQLDTLVDQSLGKKVPMTKLTAPNGEIIYMVASKVTDIYNALPGLHNPASKAVVGTRDGTQQVLEAVDEAKRIIASAHVTQ